MLIILILIGLIWGAEELFGEGGMVVALLLAVLFVAVCLIAGERRNQDAWLNRRDFWASGGPRRRK